MKLISLQLRQDKAHMFLRGTCTQTDRGDGDLGSAPAREERC